MTDHTLPPMGANEGFDAVTPMDPDIALITDYLADALSPDERARVDDRLAQDAEFHTKVWPLMVVWYSPARAEQAQAAGVAVATTGVPQRAVTEADIDRVMHRVRRESSWDEVEASVPAWHEERRRRRWWERMPSGEALRKAYHLAVVATAMVFLPSAGYNTYTGMARLARERAEGRASTQHMRMPTVIDAPPVGAPPPPVVAARDPAQDPGKAAPASAATAATVANRAETKPSGKAPDSAAAAKPGPVLTGTAPVTAGARANVPKVTTLGVGESALADSGDREVTLPGGTRMLLRAGSRFSSQHVVPPAGNMQITLLYGALDGEAVIQVPDTGRHVLRLTTPAAILSFEQGVFAIRGLPRSNETLLTVYRGSATGFGVDMKQTAWQQVDSLQFARIPRLGKLELTSGDGFPVVPANWATPRTPRPPKVKP
jgi:hypothetical protein